MFYVSFMCYVQCFFPDDFVPVVVVSVSDVQKWYSAFLGAVSPCLELLTASPGDETSVISGECEK